ncbi:hypothetical protein C8F04DRAFT_1236217 [Mycena alexandri]|uniref:Uncharacterized protein n=1 Tax=Mycena alexandri TaxID=1745969 RepID=A0AAD6SRK3_9AGAR|nr:hypothetical protein C8F04DRAFT_1236217 [Mycena alexandri]
MVAPGTLYLYWVLPIVFLPSAATYVIFSRLPKLQVNETALGWLPRPIFYGSPGTAHFIRAAHPPLDAMGHNRKIIRDEMLNILVAGRDTGIYQCPLDVRSSKKATTWPTPSGRPLYIPAATSFFSCISELIFGVRRDGMLFAGSLEVGGANAENYAGIEGRDLPSKPSDEPMGEDIFAD